MKKTKKTIVLIIGLCLILGLIALIWMLGSKKETYRVIKVYELDGEALVEREGTGEIEAYGDMLLESGDKVVLKEGKMTLRLDDDKYVYVEPDTEFCIVASGNESSNKTSIELERGAITNEIQNPLGEDSAYEVNTANSNMAVRGTVYRVDTYFVDGVRYTRVSVFAGKVDSTLRYSDGTMASYSVLVEDGKEVIIYDDGKETDYVGDPGPIDYDSLPEDLKNTINKILEGRQDTENSKGTSSREEDNQPEGPYTVTFTYNGGVFGTQVVNDGERVSRPSLSPAQSGDWDFDFNMEIHGDTVIEWR